MRHAQDLLAHQNGYLRNTEVHPLNLSAIVFSYRTTYTRRPLCPPFSNTSFRIFRRSQQPVQKNIFQPHLPCLSCVLRLAYGLLEGVKRIAAKRQELCASAGGKRNCYVEIHLLTVKIGLGIIRYECQFTMGIVDSST
jgi:hypothetical protein